MSLFFGPKREQRAIYANDVYGSLLGDTVTTKSGEQVTTNAALRHAAVWSSANLLASIVSNLPVDVFRGSGRTKTAVTPQPGFVASPSLIVSRREWMYQAMMSLLLNGNAIGYVTSRDGAQRIRSVEWVDLGNVTIMQPNTMAPPTYEISGQPVEGKDIVHMRAFLRPGTSIGMSVVQYHAESIGLGLAAQNFGASFLGNGAVPASVLKNTAKTLTDDQADIIKRRFTAVLQKKREPLVVGSDWSYEQVQVNPNESQFLDTMGYTDAQVARLFSPGLAEILGYGNQGSSLTYSNRVDRSLDLLTYGVLQWVNKFEDMFTAAIAQPQTVRFNVSALLRVDPTAQRNIFKTDREIGLHSVNELRDLLDEAPIPADEGGDDYSPLGELIAEAAKQAGAAGSGM